MGVPAIFYAARSRRSKINDLRSYHVIGGGLPHTIEPNFNASSPFDSLTLRAIFPECKRADEPLCRRVLLERVGVETGAQRAVFDEIQNQQPFANLLWAKIASGDSNAKYPSQRCVGTETASCASLYAFATRANFLFRD